MASNSGDSSMASIENKENSENKNSIAIATGYKSKAKAPLNCWIVLAEWDENYENIKYLKSAKVDGKNIKADTWYILKNGKFIQEK